MRFSADDIRALEGPLDRRIAQVVAGQNGVIDLGQLEELGLGGRGVRHRVAAGRLHRIHPAVYAVGHPGLSVDGRRMAAVLACAEGAVLSHRSAAAAWGMLNGDGRRFDLVAPGRSGGRVGDPKTMHLHRTRCLGPADVTELRGVPITTVARTLIDLAGGASARIVQRAVHEAEVARLLDVAAVQTAIARNPGRRGIRALRAALGISVPDPTNGEFAAAFLALCVDHALPTPRLGCHVDGGDRLYEVDALFPGERLIVELDGHRVHGTARSFQTDRRRDSVLAAQDFQTLRYTWHRVHQEAAGVAAELRRVLALRALRNG
jgi:hypothetical protein